MSSWENTRITAQQGSISENITNLSMFPSEDGRVVLKAWRMSADVTRSANSSASTSSPRTWACGRVGLRGGRPLLLPVTWWEEEEVGAGAVGRSSRRAIRRRTGIIAASRQTNSMSAPLYPGVDLAIYTNTFNNLLSIYIYTNINMRAYMCCIYLRIVEIRCSTVA